MSLDEFWIPIGRIRAFNAKRGKEKMKMLKVLEKGIVTECELVHSWSDVRACVKYEGLFVIVDRAEGSEEWELSGIPARAAEIGLINRLVKQMEAEGTKVEVKPPTE